MSYTEYLKKQIEEIESRSDLSDDDLHELFHLCDLYEHYDYYENKKYYDRRVMEDDYE